MSKLTDKIEALEGQLSEFQDQLVTEFHVYHTTTQKAHKALGALRAILADVRELEERSEYRATTLYKDGQRQAKREAYEHAHNIAWAGGLYKKGCDKILAAIDALDADGGK